MSNSLFSFNPIFPMTLVVAIAVSLLSFFVYREFQRKLKFLAGRIIASSLVIISLVGLLLHPTYQEVKNSDPILLLTKGYPQIKVDSIIQKNPRLKIINTK